MRYYDAKGVVLGRLASTVAKRLLNGEKVTIINADKALISGGKANILERYKLKRTRGSMRKGPYYPRRPERILRRAVRGMLPFYTSSGRAAFKNLKVFVGMPKGLKVAQYETVKTQLGSDRYMELGEVSQLLGARDNWKEEAD
jgi:large subunit ribosomal protein L13